MSSVSSEDGKLLGKLIASAIVTVLKYSSSKLNSHEEIVNLSGTHMILIMFCEYLMKL